MFALLAGLVAHADPSDVLATALRDAVAALPADERPYYVAVALREEMSLTLTTSHGTVWADTTEHRRLLDVDLRLGSPQLDNTHPLRGMSSMADDSREVLTVPLTDGPGLRRAVFGAIDRALRDAEEHLALLEANRTVLVAEEDVAPDFDVPPARTHLDPTTPVEPLDRGVWEPLMRELSERIDVSESMASYASLGIERTWTTFVDTQGAHLGLGRDHVRLSLSTHAIAEDGDGIDAYASFDAASVARLPAPETLRAAADELARDLVTRSNAPRAEPYTGPIWLGGRAAAVFVHEVLGHRAEGHRQKRDDEGKTFADLVGESVLLPTIDIVDDPSVKQVDGIDLNGHYAYDDEGTPAAPAVLVDDGIFRGFLTTNSPIPGFPESNGHARRSPGRPPLARMGNTILTARNGLTKAALAKRFRDELRRAGLPFGYRIDAIDGGFTTTGRVTPNAFNVRASAAWRVYADGRPDEPVRGLDLVGTPLTAFRNVIATGDTAEVFNGYCGAESGWVPVSGVAPALLFARLETQRKEKGEDRPPLLPKPKP